jgi:hypothetical protein
MVLQNCVSISTVQYSVSNSAVLSVQLKIRPVLFMQFYSPAIYSSTVLYVHSYPAQFYIPTYNAALTALQYFLKGSTVLYDTVLYDQFYSTTFFTILLYTMYPS